jgi:hypothetical protein
VSGTVTGRAGALAWSFGDGSTKAPADYYAWHTWTNAGVYPVTFTMYNLANPNGVSVTTNLTVLPILPVSVQTLSAGTNGWSLQFASQTNVNYTLQSATNLTPPVTWSSGFPITPYSSTAAFSITPPTTGSIFYRIKAQ